MEDISEKEARARRQIMLHCHTTSLERLKTSQKALTDVGRQRDELEQRSKSIQIESNQSKIQQKRDSLAETQAGLEAGLLRARETEVEAREELAILEAQRVEAALEAKGAANDLAALKSRRAKMEHTQRELCDDLVESEGSTMVNLNRILRLSESSAASEDLAMQLQDTAQQHRNHSSKIEAQLKTINRAAARFAKEETDVRIRWDAAAAAVVKGEATLAQIRLNGDRLCASWETAVMAGHRQFARDWSVISTEQTDTTATLAGLQRQRAALEEELYTREQSQKELPTARAFRPLDVHSKLQLTPLINSIRFTDPENISPGLPTTQPLG